MKKFFVSVLVLIIVLTVGLSVGYYFGYDNGYETASKDYSPTYYNAVAEYTTKVYREPLMKSYVEGIVIEGTEVIVRETACDFYYIRYMNSEHVPSSGWVLNTDIELYSDVNPE